MKKTYNFINCKGKKFDEVEYQCLRDEMRARVEMAYNHGFTITSIILVFWAAILAFSGNLFEMTIKENTIIGEYLGLDLLILVGVVILCGVPALLMYPYSLKFRDNIRQTVSIASYMRVFYEYPSLIKTVDNKGKENNHDNVFAWELFHCENPIPQGNFIAIELFIISIISTAMTFVFGIVLSACVFGIDHDYVPNTFLTILGYIALVFGAIYWLILCILSVRCFMNIKISVLFKKFGMIYFQEYIRLAIETKLYSQDEAQKLNDYWNEKEKNDYWMSHHAHTPSEWSPKGRK